MPEMSNGICQTSAPVHAYAYRSAWALDTPDGAGEKSLTFLT